MTANAPLSDPQCPSCGRAIPFRDSLLSLAAPFRVRCPGCQKALRLDMTRGSRLWLTCMLGLGAVSGALAGIAFALWGNVVGILVLLAVLVLGVVGEFATHRYVARRGTFKVAAP